MTNNIAADPLIGVIDLAENITPVDVWQGLHHSATAWQAVPDDAEQTEQRASIDESDISVLSALAEYPVERWTSLCDATGWTVYGAVALSWCSGASLPQVWEGWLSSGYPLLPLPEYERPARLLNPALLPKSGKLSELIAASTPSTLGLCALIAASEAPLEIDLSAEQLKNAPAQIAAFLKSRVIMHGAGNKPDAATLSVLEHNLANTEYDIWYSVTRQKTRPPMAAM